MASRNLRLAELASNVDISGAYTQSAGIAVYNTVEQLPLVGNEAGDMAFIDSSDKLYLYSGEGWYYIALVNQTPTITSGGDASYDFEIDGTPIVITLIASDPEGIPLTWSYAVTSGSLGNTATVSQSDNVFTITPSTDENDIGEFSITFTASDGVNVATSVSAFTLSFGAADQYYNYNSILLKSGSTAGLNNHTFVDESTNSHTVTRSGDVYQGSLSPYSPAGWSNYFDGSGDYLTVPHNSSFVLDGEFTVELWVYYTSTSQSYWDSVLSIGNDASTGSNALTIYHTVAAGAQVDGSLALQVGGTSNRIIPSFSSRGAGWTHVAATRDSSSVVRFFINGVLIGSATNSTSISNTTYGCRIGLGTTAQNNYFDGYVSNVRIVKGSAVYTSNFPPPTEPLTAISGTSLLTCQSNRFIDNSTNNFTITRTGDVSVQSFSPFSPSEKYDPTIHGGSAYFDGTGDYLAVPSSTQFGFGTGDFTLDMWVFPTASPTNGPGTLLDFRAAINASATVLRINSSFQITFYNGPANIDTAFTSQTVALNAWSHIAIVRSGNTVFGYINGLLAGSVAVSSNLGSNQPLWIGQNRSAGYNFNGYISNLRVVTGTAVYTTAFTPPTKPLTAISGTSLLTFQSNRLIDNSTNNFTITKTGDVSVQRFSPFNPSKKYDPTVHGGSAYFDGTGDNLSLSQQTALSFGTGDFTVEAWIYPTANPASFWSIMDARGSATTVPWAAGLRLITGNLKLEFYNGTQIQGSITVPLNIWTHVAFSRSGTAFKGFVNGVVDINTTMSTNLNIAAGTQVIGATIDPGYNTGYITDVRIVKGTALYTSAFTPPTQSLTAISGTALLLNMSNAGIYDEMTKNNIKLIGNATTSTTQTKYSDTSVYFDGSSVILLPDSMNGDFGTGDFTIEAWIRPGSTSGYQVWLDNDWNNTTYAFNLDLSNNKFNFYNSNGSNGTIGLTSVTSWTLNTWYHIAYVKSAGVLNLYVNGVFDNSVAMDVQTGRPGQSNIFLGAQTGNSNYFTGYLEDFRITKGVARYTTGFTPPTAALGFNNAE